MTKHKTTFIDLCFTTYHVVKHFYRILEDIIIGRFLRWILNNYDKRCGVEVQTKFNKQNATSAGYDVSSNIKQQLSDAYHKLELEINNKKNLEIRLKDKCEELEYTRKELSELAQTSDLFADSIADLKATIKSLTEEKVQRLTSEKKISPNQQNQSLFSTELYAEPDATGAILRKITQTVTKYSLYKLTLSSPEELICKFSVLNNDATQMYIGNRNMALQACQILEISSNPTSFETIEPGTAIKENNNWVVTSQAKIKLI